MGRRVRRLRTARRPGPSPKHGRSNVGTPVRGGELRHRNCYTGGHRWATHDVVLAPLGFGLLAAAAFIHPITTGIAIAVLIGLSLRGLVLAGAGTISTVANLLISASGAWLLTTQSHEHLHFVPLVVTLGIAIHILGDLITEEGVPVPIIWLRTRARVSISIFKVGTAFERLIVAPTLSAVTLWVLADQTQLVVRARDPLA